MWAYTITLLLLLLPLFTARIKFCFFKIAINRLYRLPKGLMKGFTWGTDYGCKDAAHIQNDPVCTCLLTDFVGYLQILQI